MKPFFKAPFLIKKYLNSDNFYDILIKKCAYLRMKRSG